MKQTLTASHVIRQVFEAFEHMELSDTKWEEFEPYHTYFAGISNEAWRGEQNGSKIRGFSGGRKLVERKQMEKKVDGGGDIIESTFGEDVDESGNEQKNVSKSRIMKQQLQERLWEMLMNMRMKLKL